MKYVFTKKIIQQQQDQVDVASLSKASDPSSDKINIDPPIIPDLTNTKKSPTQILKRIVQQLDSAPALYPISNRSITTIRDLLHKEVEKLQSFLNDQLVKNPVQADVVYFCIGHGGVSQQVWPGFIFDALQKGKKVEVYLFEGGWKYEGYTGRKDLLQEYRSYLNFSRPTEEEICQLSSLSVKQFLCGFPFHTADDDMFEESMSKEIKKFYDFGLTGANWKNRNQAEDVLKNLNLYMEKMLSAGKQVIIGNHSGSFDLNDESIQLYHQMVDKYPGNIHFLWGWGDCNLMTHHRIEDGDCDPRKRSHPWTHHAHLTDTRL